MIHSKAKTKGNQNYPQFVNFLGKKNIDLDPNHNHDVTQEESKSS